MTELIARQEVYDIVGAAMEVYNNLGPGFLEAVYQEALGIEFTARGIPFQAQREIFISYKGKCLNKTYVADFVAFDRVIVEIKGIDRLSAFDEAQLLNYLKATGLSIGLLINFGAKGNLEWKRMVLSKLGR